MNERLEDLFPFYALGALTDDERAEVDAYAAADPGARARLDEAIRTAGSVAFDAAPVEPAPRLKQALMARVAADARTRHPTAPSRWGFSGSRLFSPSRRGHSLAVATVAGILLAVLFGVWALMLNVEVNRLQQELLAQREVIAQLAASDVRAMSISGTAAQPQARGQLLTDPAQSTALLVVSNLAPLPPDRVYQFWLIRGDAPVSAGTFTVDDRGRAVLPLTSREAIGTFDAVGVSIEPSGGSRQPTGDIVMLGRLASSS